MVLIANYRRRALYGVGRRKLGDVFHRLVAQKACETEGGHIMPDHVRMLIRLPPKLAVSSVVGHINGMSTIQFAGSS